MSVNRGYVYAKMDIMTGYKAPTDYSREAVIYTIAFMLLISFLILNTEQHMGMIFTLLIAFILCVASGLAALVAVAITFFRPVLPRDRRLALVCFVLLTVYPTACILIWP